MPTAVPSSTGRSRSHVSHQNNPIPGYPISGYPISGYPISGYPIPDYPIS